MRHKADRTRNATKLHPYDAAPRTAVQTNKQYATRTPAHCEPVRLARDRHADDLDGKVKIAHHAADHAPLLVVLAAEDGDVGLDDVEELRDDLEDVM